MNTSNVNAKNIIKFVLFSAFGIGMFLIPIPKDNSFTTGISELQSAVKSWLSAILPYFVLILMLSTTVVSTVDFIWKPRWIRDHKALTRIFKVTPFYLITKILSLIITAMVIFKVGPELIISADTGANMVSLAGSLVCIVLAFSFIMPFLTDCGIMEFLGVIAKPVVRPLFRVPGRASVDLIASWFGASNAAVILTREQYNGGYYTGREASVIMTNFSLVSVPFCLLVAETLEITQVFPSFYFVICIVGIFLAFVLTRIRPLSKIPDEYNPKTGKRIQEEVPSHISTLGWAMEQSCKRAEEFGVHTVLSSGMKVLTGMFFDLIPIVITWGTVSLILVEYTPIFQWISYPMGWYLQLLGVEHAFQAAPATLVGFVDMFIPALLISSITTVKTKFIIGVLSLVQIIYLTEVGAVIIKSKVPMGLKELIIIFLERTVISLPIIVLLANILIK